MTREFVAGILLSTGAVADAGAHGRSPDAHPAIVHGMARVVLGIAMFSVSAESGELSPQAVDESEIALTAEGEDAVPGPIWRAAQTTVASIFRRLGIRVTWQRASRNSAPSERQIAILIQIAARLSSTVRERGPKCAEPEAFACSWPFDRSPGGHIVLMYERVRPLNVRPRLFPPLLGYLIAHEITHLLQRRADHSDRGIMKRHWAAADLDQMERARLEFTARDVEWIKEGLRSRFQRR